jgi:acyl-CoA synthetase (AMP-forming)/AMP-acid ligase II
MRSTVPGGAPPTTSSSAAHLASNAACTPAHATLVEALRAAATEEKDRRYLLFLDGNNRESPVTFAETWHRAKQWAAALAAVGVKPGMRVMILLPTGPDFVGALFGTLLAGATPAPCAYPLALGQADDYVLGLAPLVANARPELFLTTDSYAPAAARLMDGIGRPGRVTTPATAASPGATHALPAVDPEAVALLQYTSGPVSEPTGVVLSHRHLLANVAALGSALGLSRDDVALTWIPLVHDMGLVGGLFASLVWRCPLVVMPPQTFLMHPHQWLQNIAKYRVSLSVAPNFAYHLCLRRVRDKHLEGLDLSSWRLALNGAETVQAGTVQAFCDKFAGVGFRPTSMLPTYGLAENTLLTTCPELGAPPATAPHPQSGAPIVGLGAPVAGQKLAIQGPGGDTLAEREIGEVVVRGPCVMRGYVDNDAATARALAGGWLHTGDLGFVDGGQLFITGRKKQMVIKMGRNYYPVDVERVVQARLGHDRVVAVARPNAESGTEDLVLFCEATPSVAAEEKELRNSINADLLARLGIRAEEIRWLAPGTLPAEPRPAQRAWAQDELARGTSS